MTIVIPTNKTAVGASPAPIRAELAGSRCCSALGISVNASAPVLALARQLTCSGFDPKQILEVYRGSTLCFRVKLAAAAPLAVRDNSPGTPVFVPLRERTMRTASPVAPNHRPPPRDLWSQKTRCRQHRRSAMASPRCAPLTALGGRRCDSFVPSAAPSALRAPRRPVRNAAHDS